PCWMIVARSVSLKPPVCCGVCVTPLNTPVAVSLWQFAHAGGLPGGSRKFIPPASIAGLIIGIPPSGGRMFGSAIMLLYRALPVSQSESWTWVMVRSEVPHMPPASAVIVTFPAFFVVIMTTLPWLSSVTIDGSDADHLTPAPLTPLTIAGTLNV